MDGDLVLKHLEINILKLNKKIINKLFLLRIIKTNNVQNVTNYFQKINLTKIYFLQILYNQRVNNVLIKIKL